MAAHDLTAAKFGKLTVLSRAGVDSSYSATWNVVCECGAFRVISGTSLRAGRRKSCGCSSPKFTPERLTTHGKSKSRTYQIWVGMRYRCSAPDGTKNHRNYAARGIKVCERWSKFENFLLDMGEAPDKMSIDRIDNSIGYEPTNCRLANSVEQSNNTRKNKILTNKCESMTLAQWAKK